MVKGILGTWHYLDDPKEETNKIVAKLDACTIFIMEKVLRRTVTG